MLASEHNGGYLRGHVNDQVTLRDRRSPLTRHEPPVLRPGFLAGDCTRPDWRLVPCCSGGTARDLWTLTRHDPVRGMSPRLPPHPHWITMHAAMVSAFMIVDSFGSLYGRRRVEPPRRKEKS
jgi:hypothetical protein